MASSNITTLVGPAQQYTIRREHNDVAADKTSLNENEDQRRAAAPRSDAVAAADQDGESTPWQPGRVPWGWRQGMLGIFVAVIPFVALQLLAIAADGKAADETEPTLGQAIAGIIVTLVLDSWFVFAAWLFSLRRSGLGLAGWGFRRVSRRIFWAVPAALVAVFIVNAIYNYLVEPREQEVIEQFPANAGGLALFILLACVIAPLFEEMFFRGFLFQAFTRSWGAVPGALISSVLFGLSHQQLDVALPLAVLGLALAWMFVVTRSLWGAVALHSVFNAVAVLAWALDWVS